LKSNKEKHTMHIQSLTPAHYLANALNSIPTAAGKATANTSSSTGTSGTASSSSSSSSSTSSTSSSTILTGNDFITLLTAQLQAQDPLDPLDPNQMVDELTEMNSLQQLIGIKSDLDTMLGNAGITPPSTTSTGDTSSLAAAQYLHAGTLNPYHQDFVIQQKLSPAGTPPNS
jgi:flagellar basal-body rod modification protein FlgD